MKTLHLVILGFLVAAPAHAFEVRFACGDKKDQGVEKADVGLVINADDSVLYVSGKPHGGDAIQATNRGSEWVVTLFGEGEKDDHKFVFRAAQKDVQESSINSANKERRLGGPLACLYDENNS